MINIVCKLVINLMKVLTDHNIIVLGCLSFILIRYINKVVRNKVVTVVDNISVIVYVTMILTATL